MSANYENLTDDDEHIEGTSQDSVHTDKNNPASIMTENPNILDQLETINKRCADVQRNMKMDGTNGTNREDEEHCPSGECNII